MDFQHKDTGEAVFTTGLSIYTKFWEADMGTSLPPADAQESDTYVISCKVLLLHIDIRWMVISYQIMWIIMKLNVHCMTVSLRNSIKDTCCESLSISLKALTHSKCDFRILRISRDHCSKVFLKTLIAHCFYHLLGCLFYIHRHWKYFEASKPYTNRAKLEGGLKFATSTFKCLQKKGT